MNEELGRGNTTPVIYTDITNKESLLQDIKDQRCNFTPLAKSDEIVRLQFLCECHISYDKAKKLIELLSSDLNNNTDNPFENTIRGSISRLDYTDLVIKDSRNIDCKVRYGSIFSVTEPDNETYFWLVIGVRADGFIFARKIDKEFYDLIIDFESSLDNDEYNTLEFAHGGYSILNAKLNYDGKIFDIITDKVSKNKYIFDRSISLRTMRKIEKYLGF